MLESINAKENEFRTKMENEMKKYPIQKKRSMAQFGNNLMHDDFGSIRSK